jgi:hypothetical protein
MRPLWSWRLAAAFEVAPRQSEAAAAKILEEQINAYIAKTRA